MANARSKHAGPIHWCSAVKLPLLLRRFVLELEPYTLEQLSAHEASEHKRCEFCDGRLFYGADELYSHMMRYHFECQLCQQQGKPHLYFRVSVQHAYRRKTRWPACA